MLKLNLRVCQVSHKNYGQGRVAHEAAESWVMGKRMGLVGSARMTLICSERPFRSIFA